MIFHDFEVFNYDWLVCIIDTDRRIAYSIVNDADKLKEVYEANANNIWVGFNNRHYDQYILKGILLGMNPKKINDQIIIDEKEGWQISSAFKTIPLISYDVMPNPPIGLKTLEGFMGSDIRETDVPFNLNRHLTEEEIQQTIKYCMHDVEETYKVFLQTTDVFNAMFDIVKAFRLPFRCIGDTEAGITAKVLGCERNDFHDEFNFEFEPCIRLNKYHNIMDWFAIRRGSYFYHDKLTELVAGVPHNFGIGGIHGAPDHPVHYKGSIYHVDVNNYYPSYLIAHHKVTRAATNDNYHLVYNTRKELKRKQQAAKDKAEAKRYKSMQLPYKKLLNALSGAMKDKMNPAYDPRSNNCMCINGQLMLLDLIEHLEVIPGFVLIQSNTDGLIVKISNTDEAFDMMDDVCFEWECRCSTADCQIGLALDTISEIWQKDVNNYIWIEPDGSVERKGAYLKELSPLDYDLPIINEALVAYFTKKIPVSTTINQCNDLIKFQKVVKLSDKYDKVEHERGNMRERYSYKCYRVFASNDRADGRILKMKSGKSLGEKFANTPDHCFINNKNVVNAVCPDKLDKQWYIKLALKRLEEFGISCGRQQSLGLT